MTSINIDRHDLSPEVYETIRLVGRKHAFKVLHLITHQPLSFNEIKEELNISASMLSDLLSDFQLKNIIEKRQIASGPVKYSYFMTDNFGHALCTIIESITEWGAALIDSTNHVTISKIDMES